MSRIGKQPIIISDGVTVSIDGSFVAVKGPKGELQHRLHQDIAAVVEEGMLTVSVARPTKQSPALWGLSRSLIANMVQGVVSGFEKKLQFEGVGYRVAQEGTGLACQLGFSHPVAFRCPEGIDLKVEKNIITVSGIDKALVGLTAARIRALKPPEPYKGKGIRYEGEVIRRKAGKKAVAAA